MGETPSLCLSLIINAFAVEAEMIEAWGGERMDNKNLLRVNNALGRGG